MAAPVRIFLSYHFADTGVAEGLKKHLLATFSGMDVAIYDRSSTYPGTDSVQGGEAWLRWADLCLVIYSADYLTQETSLEWEWAKRLEKERRPALQVLVVLARNTAIPQDFRYFPITPGTTDPVLREGIGRDQQLLRVAQTTRMLYASRSEPVETGYLAGDFKPDLAGARRHLLQLCDQLSLKPALTLLRKIAGDARFKKTVYELEDNYGEVLRQGRLSKIPLPEYQEKTAVLRADVQYIIGQLQESELVPAWQAAFWQATHSQPGPASVFTPVEEITIPETLHVPVSSSTVADNLGGLSYQQKTEFRRQLLLCQDAIGIENYTRAHSHCEHVRTHIDPQSAQLYEYLLITYLQKETPERIALDAVDDDKHQLLNHMLMYASRLREYQQAGLCSSQTAEFNLRACAEELSEAMARLYDELPNNQLTDTGKIADEAPDNRALLVRCREMAELIYRSVFPYTGFLETLVVELCGGGKFDWIQSVEVSGDELVFLSRERFELETSINELLNLLVASGLHRPYLEQRLRYQLLLRLKAKRSVLQRLLYNEVRHLSHFSDQRLAVLRQVQACLMGYQIFGDTGYDDSASFLRMAIEYLLPGLVLHPSNESVLPLRWFDLDAEGGVRTHPECAAYHFDALAVVAKMIHDHAGKAGWLRVGLNIKETVFYQYVNDVREQYEQVQRGLQWTDIRRINDLEARQKIIDCFQRWHIAYLAYPLHGQDYIDVQIREIAGMGLMRWLHLGVNQLGTHPDSMVLGFDARTHLKELVVQSHHWTEENLRPLIAAHLFIHQLQPAYEQFPAGHEDRRRELANLLMRYLQAYRLHPDASYLDVVFRELTEEHKLPWMDIGYDGKGHPWAGAQIPGFDPLAVVRELSRELLTLDPERYGMLAVRKALAEKRYRDQETRYFREISEFKHENRQPEREVAIDVIRRMKGIFRHYPDLRYLELPWRELTGKGRIRWQANLLGLIRLPENHFENEYFIFDYKSERAEINMFRETLVHWMEQVLRETGDMV